MDSQNHAVGIQLQLPVLWSPVALSQTCQLSKELLPHLTVLFVLGSTGA
jgi:hypothetical protein